MTEHTLLFRQINPSYVRRNPLENTIEVRLEAFMPRINTNQSNISVDDGDRISAETAWGDFVKKPYCKSMGVLGVSVLECKNLQLSPRDAPTKGHETHVEIYFPSEKKDEWKIFAAGLRDLAVRHDWFFGPLE